MTAMVEGQVRMSFITMTAALPCVESERLRGLATTGEKRGGALPNLPTIAESGFPGFEASAWYGLLVPAGTSNAIISRLYEQTVRALNAPEVKNRLEAAGFNIVGSSPAAFGAYMKAEIKKWAPVIESSGVKPE